MDGLTDIEHFWVFRTMYNVSTVELCIVSINLKEDTTLFLKINLKIVVLKMHTALS